MGRSVRVPKPENIPQTDDQRLTRMEFTLDSVDRTLQLIQSDIKRLDLKIDEGIQRLDAKIDSHYRILDGKIDAANAKMEAGFQKVDEKFETMHHKIDSLKAELASKMDSQLKWLLGTVFGAYGMMATGFVGTWAFVAHAVKWI